MNSVVRTKPLAQAMTEAGMAYAGEATDYCAYLRGDCVNGVPGRWIRHEFGGDEVFQPSSTDRGYFNKACYKSVASTS